MSSPNSADYENVGPARHGTPLVLCGICGTGQNSYGVCPICALGKRLDALRDEVGKRDNSHTARVNDLQSALSDLIARVEAGNVEHYPEHELAVAKENRRVAILERDAAIARAEADRVNCMFEAQAQAHAHGAERSAWAEERARRPRRATEGVPMTDPWNWSDDTRPGTDMSGTLDGPPTAYSLRVGDQIIPTGDAIAELLRLRRQVARYRALVRRLVAMVGVTLYADDPDDLGRSTLAAERFLSAAIAVGSRRKSRFYRRMLRWLAVVR